VSCDPYQGGFSTNIEINRVSIHDNAAVIIGSRVLIGPEVLICTGTHDVDSQERQAATGTSFAHPIRIDDDVWIGMRATILPGVRVGKGSTVAAGALVTKDIPPGVVVGGVPAKVIRHLNAPVQ
jgi:acetyltransferase-like isoleucine patch superfamily enzyme